MAEINGKILDIVFENKDNGYKICVLDADGEEVTIRGILPSLYCGENIRVTGTWQEHKVYGRQLVADSCISNLPDTEEDIMTFLSSGIIEGVGSATAKRIVDRFGKDSLNIILESPSQLETIKGISHNKAMVISEAVSEQVYLSEIVVFFNKHGISTNFALKAFKKYGANTINIIQKNPYKLVDDLPDVGFRTADSIALSLGLNRTSQFRAKAGLMYVLTQGYQNGHVFLPLDVLLDEVQRLLEDYSTDYDSCLSELESENKIMVLEGQYGKHVYIKYMFDCEYYISEKLIILSGTEYKINKINVDDCFTQFGKSSGFYLDQNQQQAVESAATKGFSVITGGPGTGKTTIIKALVHLLESEGLTCFLAAPTGRAAKRMNEACDHEAKTIHRLLEFCYNRSEDDNDYNIVFGRNEYNKLECDCLIIDESSMIDTVLMYHLLKAVDSETRLILVGDKDQLPSVGPGSILRDIIRSERFSTVMLTEIYRQANASLIPENSKKINNGYMPDFNDPEKDFFLLRRRNQADCLKTVVDLCVNRLPSKYGIDPLQSIQVIIPVKKGECGVINVNEKLQSVLNPESDHKKERKVGDVTFREGDRVMQIKNNYEIEWSKKDDATVQGMGIFNGDMGVIDYIDTDAGEVRIIFDDERCAIYGFSDLIQLEHCYAITVHKSQGSEFDYCILPVFGMSSLLMTRNLLYTAVTRAKKMVILVGMDNILQHMIDNNLERRRYTGLCQWLSQF